MDQVQCSLFYLFESNRPQIIIGCVGRIISNEETDEGRKNIILYGITRIKIDEIIYTKPYRQAKINILPQTNAIITMT